MSDVIAFSLYGTDPRYLIGAVENAIMAKEHYPNWKVHVWVREDVPSATLIELRLLGATIWNQSHLIADGMFWRFLAHDLPGVQRYIVRDVDSRFSKRETDAVQEWIEAGTQLHVMRDHPFHSAVMLGGMWGWLKQKGDFSMRDRILKWISAHPSERSHGQLRNEKWPSETFLSEEVWTAAESKTIHDSCGTAERAIRNWPANGPAFVGEYAYLDGSFNQAHRETRLAHLSR